MNKSSLLLLGSMLSASPGCGAIKPGQNPDAMALEVPVESVPQSPGKNTPEKTQAPEKQNRPPRESRPPAAEISEETRARINAACINKEPFLGCGKELSGLFMEMADLLPAAVSTDCTGGQNSSVLCMERTFDTYLNRNPRLKLYRQVKTGCLALLSQCQEKSLSGIKPKK